jgi:serine/threonine protein kinase
MNLVNWASPYLEKRKPRIRSIVDSSLGVHYSLPGAEKAAKLASRCLSVDPMQRPSMEQVVEVLEQLQDAKNTEKKTSLSYGSKGKTRGEPASASKNKGISRWLKGSSAQTTRHVHT